jgi:FG-GAP-like repeat
MFTPQLADYDGDGLADLITGSDCCQEGRFYVFRRLKDGGFAPRQPIQPVFPPEQFDRRWLRPDVLQSRIAVADLNGDGKPDALIGAADRNTLGVVYGPLAGKDELTVQRMWPEGKEPFGRRASADFYKSMSTNLVLADWDRDGLADLILGVREWGKEDWHRRGVYWSRNIGTQRVPKFGPSQLLVADNDGRETTGICVADWNGDGRPDLIASRIERDKEGGARPWHQKVWVYLRRGG